MPKTKSDKAPTAISLVGAALTIVTQVNVSLKNLMFASDAKSFQDDVVCPLGKAYSILNNARKAESGPNVMDYDPMMTAQDKAAVLAQLQLIVDSVQNWETIDDIQPEEQKEEEELATV